MALGARPPKADAGAFRCDRDPVPEGALVSVLMSSYNYEQYVKQSIESVARQTYANIELIIVDDGSKDQSISVIEAALEGIRFPAKLIAQPNAGQASAMNRAYEESCGQVIAFIDSDDLWEADKIEAMVHHMRHFPGGGVYQHMMDNGRGGLKRASAVTSDVFAMWQEKKRINISDPRNLMDVYLPTSGLVFERAVLDCVMPIPGCLISCPDAFLTRTSLVHGPLYTLPRVLGTWRDHGENAGPTRFGFKQYWVPVVMPALNEHFRQKGIPLEFYYEPREVSVTRRFVAKVEREVAAADSGQCSSLGRVLRWLGFRADGPAELNRER